MCQVANYKNFSFSKSAVVKQCLCRCNSVCLILFMLTVLIASACVDAFFNY